MTTSHDLPRTMLLWLAILGAVVPWIFFGRFIVVEGAAGFIPALFVNGAAGGFTTDLLIPSLVFWIFAFTETKRGALRRPWIYVVINLAIGLSCALPLALSQWRPSGTAGGASSR